MNFGSVCSGIEAATVAWNPLGWECAWLAEIEPFACAVLAHHYPTVPNLGDMTTIAKRVLTGEVPAPDVLCGGTPCQAFSVAGLRQSLSDERGNLSLRFVELADAVDHVRVRRGLPASVVVWENVPGVLSTKDNAFGCFLAGLAGEDEPLQPAGGKWSNAGAVYGPARAVAWRTLDAQYFGVAQRRRRVFVVASARNDFDPATVLFEWQGVRRDSAPSREARKDVTECDGTLTASGGGLNRPAGNANELDFCVTAVMAHGQGGAEIGIDRSPTLTCNHEAPIAFPANLSATQHASTEDIAPALGAKNPTAVAERMAVRRLTPVECERLQGFPDDYTSIPWRTAQEAKRKGISYETLLAQRGMTLRGPSLEECPDGPRYKALGNSWAVPVARWIGQRIQNELHAAERRAA